MKPKVAVSACLLGQKVRYDGKDKYTGLIAEELSKYCQLIALCPEVEIGLTIPRAKIQLTQVGSVFKVLKTDQTKEDVSAQLIGFAHKVSESNDLSGMVLQDRSPSCGIANVKLYSETGKQIALASGLFASTIKDLLPDLVMLQASQLQTIEDVKQFVEKLLTRN